MTSNTITKIKLKKGKPTIEGTRAYPGGAVESYTVEGTEVAPELIAALSGMLNTLINNCYLADDWEKGEVSGLLLKQVKHEHGVVITGQLRTEDGPVVVVNSPYLSPDCLTQSEQMAIKRILSAADTYIESLPVQMDLVAA
jgi:hypothetical protein